MFGIIKRFIKKIRTIIKDIRTARDMARILKSLESLDDFLLENMPRCS